MRCSVNVRAASRLRATNTGPASKFSSGAMNTIGSCASRACATRPSSRRVQRAKISPSTRRSAIQRSMVDAS